MDALAMEVQFAQHLAPVWRALPDRGTFYVDPSLVDAAALMGIAAVPSPRPPRIPAYPSPRFDGPPLLVASYGDIKVGRRLGYGPFVFIEHGIGQSYAGDARYQPPISGSYSGGPDRADVGLFLVPNQHAAGRWRQNYPDARVEIVGCPRLADLPQREPGPGPVVCVAFHWQTPYSLGPEAGNALGEYAPALPELAKRFTVIGHSHPKGDWPARMQRIYERAGIPFVASFPDVCRQADLFIADNTSCLFEFASTGRPVVVLNSKAYRRHINHGLRFWDAATVGYQVNDRSELAETVEKAVSDPPDARSAREAALGIVYQPRSGDATLAVSAITDWLANRASVAA